MHSTLSKVFFPDSPELEVGAGASGLLQDKIVIAAMLSNAPVRSKPSLERKEVFMGVLGRGGEIFAQSEKWRIID